jgi:hypothetical protein
MIPVMARTRTDRLRIDSAGGETGSKIDKFSVDPSALARSTGITTVTPFLPDRLPARGRLYPCEKRSNSKTVNSAGK